MLLQKLLQMKIHIEEDLDVVILEIQTSGPLVTIFYCRQIGGMKVVAKCVPHKSVYLDNKIYVLER